MKITKRQLRRIVREAIIREQDETQEEIPADIQKKLDKDKKFGIVSDAVYDPETRKWRVVVLQ